jgi:AraC-like DNA-binding protein
MPFDAGTKWSFSTREMPPDDRVASVRGLRERGILHLEPLPDLVARVEITKYALPGVKILAGTLSGLLQIGSAHDPGGQDHLFLGINLTGRSAVRQPGREYELNTGQAALFSCIDEGFSAYRPTPVSFLGLRVAHKVVAPLGVRLDDGRMRSISADTGCLRLLTTYLRFICSWETTDGSALPATMAAHVADLVALIAHADLGAPPAEICGVRAARLQAAKSDILRNLGDLGLSVAAVAARQGVTPRYIHKLFESEGATYSEFVLDRRLRAAHRLLTNRRLADRSIASVAFDCGFADLSYFNRTFRRRYIATPTEVRSSGELRSK